jgi:hypothetical protein
MTLRLSDATLRVLEREERRLSQDVEVWLATSTLPTGAIVWYVGWDLSRPIVAADAAHLGSLIDGLSAQAFGGIRRHGSQGAWAQAKRELDSTTYIELHPYRHEDGVGPATWSSMPGLTATDAGHRAWSWVSES